MNALLKRNRYVTETSLQQPGQQFRFALGLTLGKALLGLSRTRRPREGGACIKSVQRTVVNRAE